MALGDVHWLVMIAGGRGPDIWDNEFIVEAPTFDAAYQAAKAKLAADPPSSDWDFVSIEQQD